MKATRVFELLDHQLSAFPKEDAIAMKVQGNWVKYSTQDYKNMANAFSMGLLKLGIKKDDKVAIVSSNRTEWNFTDMGIQQLGAISVPVYPNLNTEDYKFILEHSESRIVFVGNDEIYQKVKKAAEGNSNIIGIYSYDKIEGVNHWSEVPEMGKNEDFTQLNTHRNAIAPEDILTIIYTSGTTGQPKGVLLTHNNLISNVKAAMPLLPVDYTCRALSFLPLCHVYERMLNYLYMSCGVSVYYAESMETIGDNLKEIHPHIFVTVPRLLEKVYDKIVGKGAELTGIKKMLFFWALNLGLRYQVGTPMGWWYNFQLKIANKIIFSKWREALGGSLVCAVSGGAALQPRLASVFSAAQITILEGYGLTETSPVIAVNRMEEENRRIGTVGPVIEGVEVKIAEDGEILSRGPHIMKGYYKRPDLTDETIDKEGWLHTGDIGMFVEGKFLKITDRKKEIFKTSGGKYIAPQQMENKFKESKFIEQIMVIGDGQKFPAALVVPSFVFLKDYCELKGIPFESNEKVIKNEQIISRIQQEVDALNENYAQYERIKKFKLLPKEFTIVDGEMTPTLKLKRKVVMAKYEKLVEEIYKGE
jgi:long-chain acyl-CoA synthetase